MRLFAAVVVCGLFVLVGCATGDAVEHANLLFKDIHGGVVAMARIELPDPWPTGRNGFTGKWQLLTAEPTFPKEATTSGSYSATASTRALRIDLNPGWNDNNIFLDGTIGPEVVTGTWTHSTFVGVKDKGAFTILRHAK